MYTAWKQANMQEGHAPQKGLLILPHRPFPHACFFEFTSFLCITTSLFWEVCDGLEQISWLPMAFTSSSWDYCLIYSDVTVTIDITMHDVIKGKEGGSSLGGKH